MELSRYIELWDSDEYIRMPDLKAGFTYLIVARNAHIGIWIPENRSFLISRFKFGDNYLFEEYHWDTGEPHGTVKPQCEIEKAPFELKIIKSNPIPWEESEKQKQIRLYLNQVSDTNDL